MRWLALTLLAAGCLRPDEHHCAGDGDCGLGTCVLATGFCAFVDDTCCGDGLRYGEGAGGLSYACVSSACADVDAAPGVDAAIDATIDAAPPTPAHLAAADAQPSLLQYTVSGAVVVDTTALTVSDRNLPSGAFVTAPQVPSGPALAVLHLDTLTITAGAVVRVTGTRPLVIVARDVTIDGRITAGAVAATAGPGAVTTGPGTGGTGASVNANDGGGGGGGHGAVGGSGGTDGSQPGATGGTPGQPTGTPALDVLVGGSAGGSASVVCSGTGPRPGGGGGALQISATGTLRIGAAGVVDAGGGGGGAGRGCFLDEPGRGGGAGGAIYLQATVVTNLGVIAANGGGGGGAGATTDDGTAGADAGPSVAPAAGGTTGNAPTGGAGGSRDQDAGAGTASGSGDGGGGGGAVGRIVLRGASVTAGQTSPPAIVRTD